VNTDQLIQEISAKEFDLDHFVGLAIDDGRIGHQIVTWMLTHPHIMVYYHCYCAVAKASQKRPDPFYAHWDQIAPLLEHPNSYHRDFALTILAMLTQVDSDDRFSQIFDDYIAQLNDAKFMTGQLRLLAPNTPSQLTSHRVYTQRGGTQ
jgi:hypothetical protein